jgi:hypothetical protein
MTSTLIRNFSVTTGYLSLLCGIGAVALERPWPSAPQDLPDFLAANRTAALWQGMLFLLGAALFMWFLGSLRAFMLRHEPNRGRVTMVAFAAGMVGYGMTMLALAPQIALTLPDRSWIGATTAAMAVDLGYVMLTVANVPIAVMYVAVAVVSLRDGAFPSWLGWLSVAAAGCSAVLALSLIDPTGPVAPQGWLSYLLYLGPVVWLTATPTVMLLLGRQRTTRRGIRITVTG